MQATGLQQGVDRSERVVTAPSSPPATEQVFVATTSADELANDGRPVLAAAVSIAPAPSQPVQVELKVYDAALASQYRDQIVSLIMANTGEGKAFDAGSFTERTAGKLLDLSVKAPHIFSPTVLAIDKDTQELIGVMLSSKALGGEANAADSGDKRLAEIWRIINAAKFPFRDAGDRASAAQNIWVPCGIVTVDDAKYRGQGIARRLYNAALQSLEQGEYAGKVKYLATGHKVENPAGPSTKLHDNAGGTGASKEYLENPTFTYGDDHNKRCIRIFHLNQNPSS